MCSTTEEEEVEEEGEEEEEEGRHLRWAGRDPRGVPKKVGAPFIGQDSPIWRGQAAGQGRLQEAENGKGETQAKVLNQNENNETKPARGSSVPYVQLLRTVRQ